MDFFKGGRKRIKLGDLFSLPPFAWMKWLHPTRPPRKRWYFPNDIPFLGFGICLLLYPFMITLPFQVKGNSTGPRERRSKGPRLMRTLCYGDEVPTIACISLHSMQTLINTTIIKLSSIYPVWVCHFFPVKILTKIATILFCHV